MFVSNFYVDSLEKFVLVGWAETIDLQETVVEIAKINNYQGSALSSDVVCPLKSLMSVPKICAEIAVKSISFREIIGS